MERMYDVIMETKSGDFYDLVFRGLLEEVYLQAKNKKVQNRQNLRNKNNLTFSNM